MAAIRVWVKKRLRVDHLDFDQKQMLKLGTVAVAENKDRVGKARNLSDGPSKPLTKRYAIRKSRNLARGGIRRVGRGTGRKNVRDLSYTGNMLRNFQVRTVTERRAMARNSTRLDRIKARSNQKKERWVGYSPQNVRNVTRAGTIILNEMLPRLVLKRVLGGRQR